MKVTKSSKKSTEDVSGSMSWSREIYEALRIKSNFKGSFTTVFTKYIMSNVTNGFKEVLSIQFSHCEK